MADSVVAAAEVLEVAAVAVDRCADPVWIVDTVVASEAEEVVDTEDAEEMTHIR